MRYVFTHKEGIMLPIKVLTLTFTSCSSATVKEGYLDCEVGPYIPNPLRCFQCQQFDHLKAVYHGFVTCACCSGKYHSAYKCKLIPHCVNCSSSHLSYFCSCSSI